MFFRCKEDYWARTIPFAHISANETRTTRVKIFVDDILIFIKSIKSTDYRQDLMFFHTRTCKLVFYGKSLRDISFSQVFFIEKYDLKMIH